MTVPVGIAKVQYLGTGSTGPFAFNFVTYDQTHVKAVKTGLDGLDTPLVLTTDFTVIVAADNLSASVTLNVALAGTGIAGSSEKLTLFLDPPVSQAVQWTRNDAFPFQTHQRAADLAVQLISRLNEKIGRSVLLPESSAFSGLTLPEPVATYFLRWNVSGTALENVAVFSPGALTVSPYIQTLLDDANAGAAQTTLGISAYAQTLLDDANATAARATLAAAALATNTFSDTQTVTAGNATTLKSFEELKPSDFGTGKPLLRFQKSATATKWTIGLNDGTNNAGTIDLDASAVTVGGTDVAKGIPSVQRFLSGSGTYTPTAGTRYARGRIAGGGGGGGAALTNVGTAGGDTSFGAWVAKGGAGGGINGQAGGAGGTGGANGTGTLVGRFDGTDGTPSSTTGGHAGGSAFFGGSAVGKSANGAGNVGKTNTGGGGSGGVQLGTAAGADGGGGESVEFFMTAAQIGASLSYAVGAAGVGGAAGTQAGGNGAAGIIIIEEYF